MKLTLTENQLIILIAVMYTLLIPLLTIIVYKFLKQKFPHWIYNKKKQVVKDLSSVDIGEKIIWERVMSDGAPAWRTPWATVWDNGTWFTWDQDGVGGENSEEDTIHKAMYWATLCALRQGFIELRPMLTQKQIKQALDNAVKKIPD